MSLGGPISRTSLSPEDRLRALEREDSLRTRLCARDEQALVELVDLATPWLLGVTQAMLRDRDEAEEVVLDTFRTVWEKVTPVSADSHGLMSWVLHIGRNKAIDRLRARRRRRLAMVRAEAGGAWGESAAPPVEPNEAAHPGWQVHQSVHAALAALPEEQLAAVRLAYFEGLTHSEIAERLGIPLGTVKTRLRLAFNRLRGSLGQLRDWVL